MSIVRHVWAVSLLVAVMPVQADVYRYVDEQGNQVFTDAPREGAEKIKTSPVMTIPFPRGAAGGGTTTPAARKPAEVSYVITMKGPSPDGTYRRGDDAVPVAVSVSPSLEKGHDLVLLLDGQPWQGEAIVFDDALDRGAHTLEARVVGEQGNVLASSSLTFYVKQHSTMAPTAPKPKPKPKS